MLLVKINCFKSESQLKCSFNDVTKKRVTKSSADSMGDSILSTVRKAAKLAVYDEIMMRVKNHHIPATIRVDMALKIHSQLIQMSINLYFVTKT